MDFKYLIVILGLGFCANVFGQKNEKISVAGSNLPIVEITTDNAINGQKKVTARMKIAGQYDGNIKIKYRGNSSQGFPQKKFSIETKDDSLKDLDVPLFGMPADNEWALLCPYNDVSMMRDALAFRMWSDMGHWAPRLRMVEVTLNGEYQGVYGFSETIKQGEGRVGVKTPKNTDPKTQGYLLRIDKYDQDDLTFRSDIPGLSSGFMNEIVWTCRYPKVKKVSEDMFNYIKRYVSEAEAALCDKDSPKAKAEKYVDLASFVDYFIHTELSLNADAYKSSSYFYKEPDKADGTKGLLHAGSVWDYNLAYGCCSFCNAGDINAWAFDGCETSATPAFWRQFAVDKELNEMVRKRYRELRKTSLSDEHVLAIVDEYATQLSVAQKRQFEKYPELLGDSTTTTLASQPNAGFPMMGGFPQMPMGGFPQMGNFPQMDNFPQMPEGGFPPMMFGGFPQMQGEGMPQMPQGGFPQMQGFDFSQMMGGFAGMGGAGMLEWFRSYTVKSYEEEITHLKQWLKDRLAVMDKRFL